MEEIVNDSLLGEGKGQEVNRDVPQKRKGKGVKKKRKRKNNHTKPKQKTENLFTEVPQIWSRLTIKEKRKWHELLKSTVYFRNKKNNVLKDARQLFISLNRNLQEINEPIIRIAPRFELPQSMFDSSVDIILKGEEVSMNFNIDTTINQNTKLVIYATPSLTSAASVVNYRLFRKIAVLDSSFVPGSSIKEYYLKVFEKIGGVGEEIGFRYHTVIRDKGIKGLPKGCIASVISQENQ